MGGPAVARQCLSCPFPERRVEGDGLRSVSYPISQPDPETGLATVKWIANLNFDPSRGFDKEENSREANVKDFLPAFEDFVFDRMDAPALVRCSDQLFELPNKFRAGLSQIQFCI